MMTPDTPHPVGPSPQAPAPKEAILDKLCPFCPNENQSIHPVNIPRQGWAIRCMDCGATGPACETEVMAREAWNRRTPTRAQGAAREALRDLLAHVFGEKSTKVSVGKRVQAIIDSLEATPSASPQAPTPTIDAGWAMRTADHFRHLGIKEGAAVWRQGLEIIHSQAACVLANLAKGYTEFQAPQDGEPLPVVPGVEEKTSEPLPKTVGDASRLPARNCIERMVRKNSEEWQEYLRARFGSGASGHGSFLWGEHRWQYKHSTFDDISDYEVIFRWEAESSRPGEASEPEQSPVSSELPPGESSSQPPEAEADGRGV